MPAEADIDALVDVLDELSDELGIAGASVSAGGLAGGPGGTFSVRIEASSDPWVEWSEAVGKGVLAFLLACDKAGIAHRGVAHVDAMTEDNLDRLLNEPAETYLGVSEVAKLLGVSRQRVSELRTSEAFPAPVAEIAAGPVWKGSSLRRFVETWERRPGRPRKVVRIGGKQMSGR